MPIAAEKPLFVALAITPRTAELITAGACGCGIFDARPLPLRFVVSNETIFLDFFSNIIIF
jgi:hypothetical protein